MASTAFCTKLALAAMALLTLAAAPAPPRTPQQILDAARPSEWRRVDPRHTLYMDLKSGRVVIAETRSNEFGEFQLEYEQQSQLKLCIHLGDSRTIQVPLKKLTSDQAAAKSRVSAKKQ